MTTPTGTISMSNIRNEFGPSSGQVRLGQYRVNQSIAGRNWPLDAGVPTSGPISFSQLRGKTLNVVVDYSGGTEYNVNTENRYNSSGVVVGGLRSRPSSNSSSTKKVYHVIRKGIGGTTSIASISPTQSNNLPIWGFIFANYANTLGPFLVSRREIPVSEFPQSCTWRGCVKTAPSIGTQSVTTTSSPSLGLSGGGGFGATISMTRTRTVKITRTSVGRFGGYKYWEEIYHQYSATLLSGGSGGYTQNSTVSTSWDGRTFNFNVDSVTSQFAAYTGCNWVATILNYIIASNGFIIGSGGQGARGGDNCNQRPAGSPGGAAFQVCSSCNIIMEGNGIIGGGGGGGGGGQYLYYGGPDARIHGGGGGGGAGIPGGGGGLYGGAGGICVDGSPGGAGWCRCNRYGSSGSTGSQTSGGAGGAGATYMDGSRLNNNGGNGGNLGQSGGSGGGGSSGGAPGAAIVRIGGASVSVFGNVNRIFGSR